MASTGGGRRPFPRICAKNAVMPMKSSRFHIPKGWSWQRAHSMLIPRNAVADRVVRSSAGREKKLAAPLSQVLPFAVRISRTNWSYGLFAAKASRDV